MSMTISRSITGRKFVVKLYGIRKKEVIPDIAGLHAAIAHYFGLEPEHGIYRKNNLCPFCDEEKEEPN